MTLQQLNHRVQIEADARIGETVERLLFILKYYHTHQCWKKECDCEYCRFINGEYVSEKLALHALKKRHNILENMYWTATDGEVARMESVAFRMLKQKSLIRELKQHKFELQGNII